LFYIVVFISDAVDCDYYKTECRAYYPVLFFCAGIPDR